MYRLPTNKLHYPSEELGGASEEEQHSDHGIRSLDIPGPNPEHCDEEYTFFVVNSAVNFSAVHFSARWTHQ